MDEIDKSLLRLLSENARMPVASLAATLGLARSTVQARIERLERGGAIAGYTIRRSDAARAGEIRATVLVVITPRATPEVVVALRRLPEVRLAHTTSGRFDLALTLAAETPAMLDEVLDRIGGIAGVEDIETLIHLSTRIDRDM